VRRSSNQSRIVGVVVAALVLSGCAADGPAWLGGSSGDEAAGSRGDDSISLAISRTSANVAAGFRPAVAEAALDNPAVRAAQQEILGAGFDIEAARGALAPQVSGSLYAGLTDEANQDPETGAAARLNISKVVYDGGEISASVRQARAQQQIAYEDYRNELNDALFEGAAAWIALWEAERRYALIQERLRVVRPLFSQVEQVAQSGVSDITVVTAAQRVVNDIRAAENAARDQRRQAQTAFRRVFGTVPGSVAFDSDFLGANLPRHVGEDHILTTPEVVSAFLQYQAALARLDVAEARGGTRVDLQANIDEPLDAEEEGDTTAGLVVSRTFFDGGTNRARINSAAAAVAQARDGLQAAYRNQGRQVMALRESLDAISSQIELARESREIAREEVDLLRRQLAIGQSSLENVLQAEVRLYDAENTIILRTAERASLRMELGSALGKLPAGFGLREADVLDRLAAGR